MASLMWWIMCRRDAAAGGRGWNHGVGWPRRAARRHSAGRVVLLIAGPSLLSLRASQIRGGTEATEWPIRRARASAAQTPSIAL